MITISSSGTISTDPYWETVSLLVKFITAGDTTSSFVDQSKFQRVIRRTGGADGSVIGDTTTTLFGHSTLKCSSQSNAAYISTSDPGSITSDLGFGTGDFTVEAWVYLNSAPSSTYGICGQSGSVSWIFNIISGGYITVGRSNSTIITSTTALTSGTWYHLAISRSSGVTKLFINGVQESSVADTGSWSINTGYNFGIGGNNTGTSTATTATSSGFSVGRIGELRITTGVGRYTAAFTPPSWSFPTGPVVTSLLRCENNVIDSAFRHLTWAWSGTAAYGTGKFGLNSLSFTGSNYLYSGSGFAGGNDLFVENGTIECWVKFNSVANTPHVFQIGYDASNRYLVFVSSGNLAFAGIQANQTNIMITGPAVTTGTWYHVAVVKRGTNYAFYVNGQAYGSVDRINPPFLGSGSAHIGFQGFSGTSSDYLNGYIDDFRMTMNKAIYSEAFISPTKPVGPKIPEEYDPYFSYVTLLLDVYNGSIIDRSMYCQAITNSNVTVDSTKTAISGGSSMKFAATSYMTVPYIAAKYDLAATSSVWTVEAYVYLTGAQTSISTYRLDVLGSQAASTGWEAAIYTGGLTVTYPGYGGTSYATSLTSGTWYHLVWQRNGTSYSFGVNGTIMSATTYTGDKAANGMMKIGGNLNNSAGIAYQLQGVRMTNGVNRYPMSAGSTYPVPTSFPSQ
jgi:hypothetical protein